ncbi:MULTISPECIES: helix-turn-helix transcriptional regulator [Kocuria]|uniref:Helix-turn-helix transcriptional regulator n=1 Tax=Kocuria oceani TaxID=988827 RepID=A0ABV9TEJ2_9MICC|nr:MULTISPECIES: helix-turn-helix transcriptional regulator [Kocuria]
MSPVFHREATATEPDAVTALFHEIGVRFSFDPTVPGFSYRQRQDGDGQLTVVGLDLGGPFSSWGDTDVFGVADVRAASRYDWRTSHESGSGLGRPVLFRPGHPALIVGGALEVTNVNLAPALLQSVAETVYGTEGLSVAFASAAPVSPRLGRYWTGLAGLARDTVASEAFAAELVRADLTRHLAVAMLECFPLLGDPVERTLSTTAQARRYRIAVQFLDDHASLPVSIDDAARAADTTTRALVRAFRANHPLGLTPTQYLRRTRLAAAHTDLLRADPTTGATVREIALRWGFAHPGRFAAAYRAVYGVPPRRTLDS